MTGIPWGDIIAAMPVDYVSHPVRKKSLSIPSCDTTITIWPRIVRNMPLRNFINYPSGDWINAGDVRVSAKKTVHMAFLSGIY